MAFFSKVNGGKEEEIWKKSKNLNNSYFWLAFDKYLLCVFLTNFKFDSFVKGYLQFTTAMGLPEKELEMLLMTQVKAL